MFQVPDLCQSPHWTNIGLIPTDVAIHGTSDLKSARRQKAPRSKNARGVRRSLERSETLKYNNIII